METPNNVTHDRLPQQHFCKEEKALDDHQRCNQERNSSMDRENPGPPKITLEKEGVYFSQEGQKLAVKQETDTSFLTPIHEERDRSEDKILCAEQHETGVNMPVISSVVGAPNSDLLLLSYNLHTAESPDQQDDKHEDCGSTREVETNQNKQQINGRSHTNDEYKPTMLETTVISHKEEIDLQCRLLVIPLKPEIRLHRIVSPELPQQYVCKVKEEALTEQQLVNQERNSSMEQEEPERPQFKEEPLELCTSMEVEHHAVKQETDTFLLTPTFGENERSQDQPLYLNLDETLNAAQNVSKVNMPIIYLVMGAPKSDLLVVSNNSGVPESQDQKGDASEKDLSFRAKFDFKTNSDERPYVCPTCGKDFKCKSTLTVHMKIHSDEKPYLCKTCGKDFRFSNNLTEHMRIHSNEKPYVCNTCGKGFKRNDTMKFHMKIHSDDKPYICQTCGKNFKYKSVLTEHMRIHSDEKPYDCQICGKCFRSKSKLTIHMRIHNGDQSYILETLGEGLGSNCKVTDHMRIHTGDKSYICETCGKDFRQRGALTVHMRIHSGEKPYTCIICEKRFRQNSHLIAHMRNCHSNELPVQVC